MESLYLVGVAVIGLFALILCIILFNFFGLWIRAKIANAPVSLGKMVGMRLRKVPVGMIVDNRITAVKAGIDIPSDPLEAHYLAGGDVGHVILALIAADKAGISLDFNRACAIDLATKGTGKTVLEAVRTSINPKVIDAPSANMGRSTIDGVAQDGIGVKVKARVTVRSHLDRFVGGATEETIIARVGEGIVSSIGSAASYKDVLENPDRISKTVLAKGLDSGTAFEILSIDIADVDVGENIGAKLQTDQAEADLRVARARAEERRAAAVAAEQEQRAALVAAGAQGPLALADAFRAGRPADPDVTAPAGAADAARAARVTAFAAAAGLSVTEDIVRTVGPALGDTADPTLVAEETLTLVATITSRAARTALGDSPGLAE